jgi:hypothetical protein
MIIKNKLDKAFGPVGSTAGVFIFIVGIVAGFYSMGAILLIVAGAFIGFTSTSAIIDTEQKRVKLRSDYFGIIKTGKWIDIQAGMKIGIQKQQGSWRAYSRGNRKLDIPEKNFRIYLFGENNQKVIPLDKASSFQEALDKRNELSNELGLLTA